MWLRFAVACLITLVLGGVAAALGRSRPAAVLLGLAAAALGSWGVLAIRGSGGSLGLRLGPALGVLHLGMGVEGGLFALLAGLLALAAAVAAPRLDPRGLTFYALLLGAIAWFLAAQDLLALALGWEGITLGTYALVLAGGPGRRVLRAAWKLVVLSEAGTALYIAGVVSILAGHAGLRPTEPFSVLRSLGPPFWTVLLMVGGIGVKAALAPLHVWLPDAHASAPAPVSSLLSGVVTAVAVGGMLRLLRLLPPAEMAVPGWVLLALGLTGALAGGLYAVVEPEIKRALAHGTVEVLGLVLAALGLTLLLRSLGAAGAAAAPLAALGTWTLLFQHAGAKFALFLASGEARAATGAHELDAMGGLLRRLPGAGAAAWVAALSLAGVPPLGGFVGEWMLLESLLMPLPGHAGEHAVLAILGALAAVITALGLTVYLRWFGATFLGAARSRAAAEARFPREGAVTLGCVLALVPSVAAGIGTPWVVPLVQHALGTWARGPSLIPPLFLQPRLQPGLVAVGAAVGRSFLPGAGGVVIVPGRTFSILSPWDLFVWSAVLAALLAFVLRRSRRGLRTAARWAGGVRPEAAPASVVFTASGLSHVLRLAFSGIYRLQRRRTPAGEQVHVLRVSVTPRFERHLYGPALAASGRLAAWMARLANGSPLSYVGYVLAPLLAGLLVLAVRH